MALGLGSKVSKTGLTTPTVVTDNLVLKHKYDRDSLLPVSNGAVYGDGTTSDNSITTSLASNDILQDTTAFTIAGWVKIDINTNYQKLLKASDSTNDRIELYWKNDPSDGKFILVIAPKEGTTSAAYCHALTLWSDTTYNNKWTHVAATYQPGKTRMYINGKDDTNISGSSAGATVDIDLSANLILAEHLNGYACNIGVWNKALSQGEIRDVMHKNYAGLSDANKENLQHWWNLDESIATNVTGTNDIVLNQHSGSTEIGNYLSNFGESGVVANANSGNYVSNANPPYTETYIDNDNKTIRIRALADGPDDGSAIDHVQIKVDNSLTTNKSYKFVVTVESVSGTFRIRPGANDPDGDMSSVGVHTFYFHNSLSTYWRIERDYGVGDITISDIKIYDIGYTGEL